MISNASTRYRKNKKAIFSKIQRINKYIRIGLQLPTYINSDNYRQFISTALFDIFPKFNGLIVVFEFCIVLVFCNYLKKIYNSTK